MMLGPRKVGAHAETVKEVRSYFFLHHISFSSLTLLSFKINFKVAQLLADKIEHNRFYDIS